MVIVDEFKGSSIFTKIYVLFSLMVFLTLTAFMFTFGSRVEIFNSIIWAVIIGVASIFYFPFKDSFIYVGGIFNTAAMFIFDWMYLPFIFALSYASYILVYYIINGSSESPNEVISYNLANLFISGLVINLIFRYLTSGYYFPLEKSMFILFLLGIIEGFLYVFTDSALMHKFEQDTTLFKKFITRSINNFSIYIISAALVVPLVIYYIEHGYWGLVLASSGIYALQTTFFTQSKLEEVQKKSYIDALTGVKNKQYLLEQIPDEIQDSCAVFMIDFNGFKEINDTLGHDAGDEAIIHGADILSMAVRENDVVVRFGGDEFAIFVQNGTRESCRRIIQSISKYCDEMPLMYNGVEIRIRMSVGISLCPEEGRKKDSLLNIADGKLYKAKESKNLYTVSYVI